MLLKRNMQKVTIVKEAAALLILVIYGLQTLPCDGLDIEKSLL